MESFKALSPEREEQEQEVTRAEEDRRAHLGRDGRDGRDAGEALQERLPLELGHRGEQGGAVLRVELGQVAQRRRAEAFEHRRDVGDDGRRKEAQRSHPRRDFRGRLAQRQRGTHEGKDALGKTAAFQFIFRQEVFFFPLSCLEERILQELRVYFARAL